MLLARHNEQRTDFFASGSRRFLILETLVAMHAPGTALSARMVSMILAVGQVAQANIDKLSWCPLRQFVCNEQLGGSQNDRSVRHATAP